jgi:hypothetical protein
VLNLQPKSLALERRVCELDLKKPIALGEDCVSTQHCIVSTERGKADGRALNRCAAGIPDAAAQMSDALASCNNSQG